MQQCESYFVFKENRVNLEKKVLFVTTFLKKKVENWVKPKKKNFFADPENRDIEDIFKDWDEFKKEIERVFGISNKKRTAERCL